MRVSVTTIESFHLWRTGDWMSETELIDSIKGKFVPTPKILLGQAFGRCLEKGDKYLRADGSYHVPVKVGQEWQFYVFTADVMRPCFEKFDRRGIFEAKTTRDYDGVTVVAKADQILGATIIENKSKVASSFDIDRYMESCQWRFELDLFEGATQLTYNIFLLDEDEHGEIELRGIESFNVFPYKGLHEDCRAMVRQFAEYARMRHLEDYLVDRGYATVTG